MIKFQVELDHHTLARAMIVLKLLGWPVGSSVEWPSDFSLNKE
jgi:hypothetical protein